jgi:hypothetical protein
MMRTERFDGGARQPNGAAPAVGLRVAVDIALERALPTAPDLQRAFHQIHVRPAQRDDLALTHACADGKRKHCLKSMSHGSDKKYIDLFWRVDLHFMLGDTRRFGQRGDIPRDQVQAHRIFERMMQDAMQVIDGRWGAAGGEPIGIEVLHLLRRQSGERDSANAGYGMHPEQLFIAYPCGLFHRRLDNLQPTTEIRRHRLLLSSDDKAFVAIAAHAREQLGDIGACLPVEPLPLTVQQHGGSGPPTV